MIIPLFAGRTEKKETLPALIAIVPKSIVSVRMNLFDVWLVCLFFVLSNAVRVFAIKIKYIQVQRPLQ